MRKKAPEVAEAGKVEPTSTTVQRLVIVCLAAIATCLALSSLTWPLSMDHGIIGYTAAALVEGKPLYRDAFDIKGPFAYWTYAISLLWEGDRQLQLRLLDAFMLALGSSVVAFVVPTRSLSWRAVTGLVTFIALLQLDYFNTVQPEAWVGLLVAIAMAISSRSDLSHLTRIALCSVVCALVTLHKPPFLLFLFPVCLGLWAVHLRESLKNLVLLAISTGLVIMGAILVLYFRGELGYANEAVIKFAAVEYQRGSGVSQRIYNLGKGLLTLLKQSPWIVLLVIPAIHRPVSYLRWIWIGTAILLVVLQGRYFGYHWTIVIAPAAVLICESLSEAFPVTFNRRRVPDGFLYALVFLLLGIRPAVQITRSFLYSTGMISQLEYWETFRSFSTPVRDQQNLVPFLRQHCGSSTKVFFWTNDPSPGFAARCALVSRFSSYDHAVRPTSSPLHFTLASEADSAVRASNPDMVIRDGFFERQWGKPLSRIPSLQLYVEENFEVDTTIGVFTILKRREAP